MFGMVIPIKDIDAFLSTRLIVGVPNLKNVQNNNFSVPACSTNCNTSFR